MVLKNIILKVSFTIASELITYFKSKPKAILSKINFQCLLRNNSVDSNKGCKNSKSTYIKIQNRLL